MFAQFAKDHSTCPSKKDGGDLNFFPRVGQMVEPFAEASFKLQPFQMSEVVETEFGQHLILLTDRKPGTAKKFEVVKEDVRAVYAMHLRTAVVSQMRPKVAIVINPAPVAAAPGVPAPTVVPAGAPMR